MGDATVANVYGAFLSALAIWGWFELAFLCGIITGPNVRPCPPDIPRWERFVRAWGTIAHSEMALIATAVVMVALCWEAPNAFGLWTFLVLFFARISAKLNVYLGVPNINVEFLPAPVRHLASHFRIGADERLLPLRGDGAQPRRRLLAGAGAGEHAGQRRPCRLRAARGADRARAARALADGPAAAGREALALADAAAGGEADAQTYRNPSLSE